MITVLVASCNGSRYIKQQLDSILSQNAEDVRILVSDDCSTDGTRKLLKEYEENCRDRVLVLYRDKASGGAAVHFLKLMKLMADCAEIPDGLPGSEEGPPWSGYGITSDQITRLSCLAGADYFMLSDQDDVWMPQKAQSLLAEIRRMGTDSDQEDTPLLVHSDLTVADEDLRPIADSFFRYQKITPERTKLPQLLVQNNVTGGAVMFSRGMLPYLKELPAVCLMHDAWLALIASCFGKIGCVDRPLYYYRQHGSNTLGAEKGDNMDSVKARVKDGTSARENYRKMFGQAECFYSIFESRLTGEQKAVLEAFIRLPRCSRIKKAGLIIRYGFTKNTFIRTLGQMLFIGD